MNADNIRDSLEVIKDLNFEIFTLKDSIRSKKSELIYNKRREESELTQRLEEVLSYNFAIRQEKLVMTNYQNKVTLENIRERDPKLFSLFKRFQLLEQENNDLKVQLEDSECEKKKYSTEYSSITQSLLNEEKIRTRCKNLENDCVAKEKNIEKLRQNLIKLKQKIFFPNFQYEDIKALVNLYDDLLREKIDMTEECERLQLEYSDTCADIKDLERSPKRRNSIVNFKEDVENVKCIIKALDKDIVKLEEYKEGIMEKCVGLQEIKRKMKKKVENSGESTERNFIIKQVGKELEKGRSQRAISVLKSYSKPGTPAATKVVELNRSHFIHKNLL